MNEMTITINHDRIHNDIKFAVCGRELHKKIESKQRKYTIWIKNKIKYLGLEENLDYIVEIKDMLPSEYKSLFNNDIDGNFQGTDGDVPRINKFRIKKKVVEKRHNYHFYYFTYLAGMSIVAGEQTNSGRAILKEMNSVMMNSITKLKVELSIANTKVAQLENSTLLLDTDTKHTIKELRSNIDKLVKDYGYRNNENYAYVRNILYTRFLDNKPYAWKQEYKNSPLKIEFLQSKGIKCMKELHDLAVIMLK